MERQPNLGFPTEGDAWSFAERLLRDHAIIAENPQSIFRLYDYKHTAEFYLERSRPVRSNGASASGVSSAQLFDPSRDVKKYERPSRPNQARFRAAVFQRYGKRCAFCYITFDELLDAAHLIAWKQKGADVPENGLPLCKLHHRALDCGLIRIDPTNLSLHCDGDFNELYVKVADIRHLPAIPHLDALSWLSKVNGR